MNVTRIAIVLFLMFMVTACTTSSETTTSRPLPSSDDDSADDDDEMNFGDDDVVTDDDFTPEYQRCENHPDMMLVPAGSFIFRNRGQRYEEEGVLDAKVYVDDYCIDEFEYPNIAGVLPTPVNWNEANELCALAGKRLCTGAEWQKACAGPASFIYPWGDEWRDDICNTHTDELIARDAAPSGSWPDCVSYYGVYDLCGNFSEWTADVWQEGWEHMTLRGGGSNINSINAQELQPDGFWQFSTYSQECSSVHHHEPTLGVEDDGTRCCADP